jgi:hypothetical protein
LVIKSDGETVGYDSFLTSEGTIHCPTIYPPEWSVTNEEAAYISSR